MFLNGFHGDLHFSEADLFDLIVVSYSLIVIN